MTTWSVVKDDTKENRRPGRYFRYGILASLAVLVISLGLALTPGPPPQAPEPAFSERARAAALAETIQLRLAGSKLADAVSGAERQGLLRAVTLLTTQAKALTGPDQGPSPSATGTAVGTPAATRPAPPPPRACRPLRWTHPLRSSPRCPRAAGSASRMRKSPTAGRRGCLPPSVPPSCFRRLRWPRLLGQQHRTCLPFQDRQRHPRRRQHRQAHARRSPRPRGRVEEQQLRQPPSR